MNKKLTNRQKLEAEGMLEEKAKLTKKQTDAIESLSPTELKSLIAARNKLAPAFTKRTGEVALGLFKVHGRIAPKVHGRTQSALSLPKVHGSAAPKTGGQKS